MTKAQRRKIALRNLAKAHRKTRRKSARKGGARKSRRRGKRTVALANLKKARSARRRRKAAGGAKHAVRGYSYRRTSKRVHVKAHRSYEAGESRKRSRRGRRRKLSMKKSAVAARRRRRSAEAAESPKRHRRSSRRRRHTAEPRKRRKSSRRRKHSVRGHMAKTRGSSRRHRVRRHMSAETPRKRRRSSRRRSSRRRGHSRRHHSSRRRSRRGYALENPLSGTELAVGAFTGVLGFISADALDRVLATHALTAGANGQIDNPPATGDYIGLYNGTAVLAQMDWKRWLAGAGITAVPFIIAAFIKADVGRSSLQFFGFGAGVRVLGKAATDLIAYLTRNSSYSQRLYDAELRAMMKRTEFAGGDVSMYPALPYSGLDVAAPGQGVPGMLGQLPAGVGACGTCANCVTGVGACCRFSGQSSPTFPPVVPGPPHPITGQPTPPVQITPPPATVTPVPGPLPPVLNPVIPPVIPSTPPAPTSPPVTSPRPIYTRAPNVPPKYTTSPPVLSAGTQGFRGLPNGQRRSRFQWGAEDSDSH